MKLLGIFRFELGYQIRRPWPWLAFASLAVFAFLTTRIGIVPVTLPEDFILNSPFIITAVSVLACQIWLLVGPALAGEAAARDVQTRMHPLVYASPISKTEYLGGRFFAALTLNALVLLGVQVGNLLAAFAPGVAPEIIGPFRPTAYLAAYVFIGLTNAFITTTIQFVIALKSGRPITAYLGSMILFFLSYPVTIALYFSRAANAKLALMSDPIGVFAIMNEMMSNWTVIEKNIRAFTLEGAMLGNRLLWLSIALVALAVMYLRFRFAHRVAADPFAWIARRFARKSPNVDDTATERIVVSVPRARQSFGFTTHLRQTLSVTASSFWMIAKSPAGLFLLVAFPALLVMMMQVELQHWGVPLLPRTHYLLTKFLTAPLTEPLNYWVMVPLIIVFFAGELIWRERDAGVSENLDAMPVPEWVLFAGKYLGLALVLAAFMGILTTAGIVTQLIRGYHEHEVGLFVGTLFGLQLVEYLLFAMLAFVIQTLVNQKYLGQLLTLVAYLFIVLAGVIGIEHNMLVYVASPDWFLTDMRGFGGSVEPWAWFKLYWAAWALLLAVATRVMWVRGRDTGLVPRLTVARHRFTRATIGVAAMAVGLVVTLGGFIFYNTNVVNEYVTGAESVARSAEYEKRYGRYEGMAQPQPTATKLHIEIYPDRGEATIRGSYRLVNKSAVVIDSIHVEPAASIETRVEFDAPAKRIVADAQQRHDIYALTKPLQPGDSVTMTFDVRVASRGFRNSGALRAVAKNGTYFSGEALPSIGYQPRRELMSAEDRRKHGLPRQLTFPTPDDVDPDLATGDGEVFEAVMGTDPGQVAVAPGVLRRTWNRSSRRYFQYASDIPIAGRHVFFSADYAVHHERWKDVDLWFFHDPRHTSNVDRIAKSARASLDYYTTEFGPYPWRFLQFIEQPSKGLGMGVDGSGVVTTLEGVSMLDPQDDNNVDAVFEITAHEVGHQWWGGQLKYAFAEGAIVISEGLAWYSGMQVVKRTGGKEKLRQFMSLMREPSPWPQIRTGLPLLRAMDPYAGYRKAPFAMYALSEYVGERQVNGALRRLLEKKSTSLATTLDLYRELEGATPDSVKPLLRDLFARNAFWSFDTEKATAKQTAAGTWQVTFEVEARKVIADSAGAETEVPIDEMIELGVFAAAQPGEILGKPLYVERHRVRPGKQTITVIVREKPARGGIDPYNLLDWDEGDNIEPIESTDTPE